MSEMIQQQINRARHDFRSLQDAQDFADKLTARYSVPYMATDAGPCWSPRFSVQEMPRVGDFVSYGFNGDWYPDSKIVRISKTMKKITTESGKTYYRLKSTGSWKMDKTWSMAKGKHDERNPSF